MPLISLADIQRYNHFNIFLTSQLLWRVKSTRTSTYTMYEMYRTNEASCHTIHHVSFIMYFCYYVNFPLCTCSLFYYELLKLCCLVFHDILYRACSFFIMLALLYSTSGKMAKLTLVSERRTRSLSG